MCTYVHVRFTIGHFFFFAPLGPLGLIIVRHFPKKCIAARLVRTVLEHNPDTS